MHGCPPKPTPTSGSSETEGAVAPGTSKRHAHLASVEADLSARLLLHLPASWKVDALKATPPPADLERWYWPIRWLKQLARFPHEYQTWLGFGHTIPNGDPPSPFSPETKLCGWFLLPPIGVEDEARQVTLSDGRTVHLYCLHALHLAEMALKLNKGSDALLDAFDAAGVGEELRLDRPAVVRRKLFGIF